LGRGGANLLGREKHGRDLTRLGRRDDGWTRSSQTCVAKEPEVARPSAHSSWTARAVVGGGERRGEKSACRQGASPTR